MNRRLVGLLAAFCLLSACKEEPVGRLEPIARPPGAPAAPSGAAPTPSRPVAPEPAPGAHQVLLRWKLDAPAAFQLTASAPTAAPAPSAPSRKPARGRKSSRRKAPPASVAQSPAAPESQGLRTFFLLRASEPTAGALPFALLPEAPSGETQRGTMSERGFVLGGLSGPMRDLAVMVLELPSEPVSTGSTWSLATDLVDMRELPPGFQQKDAQQRSEVKLTSLTPTAEGDQVATLEYELFESVTGQQGALKRSRRGHSHAHENAPLSVKKDQARGRVSLPSAKAAEPPADLSAEVRVSGRGEFLVKAGRWRSWEARMTTRTDGLTLPGMAAGERVLRLTPVEPVPAALLQRLATK